MIGILLLGIQLWLLTLDLYLSGYTENTWQLVIISGLVFLGGLALLHLLSQQPHPTA